MLFAIIALLFCSVILCTSFHPSPIFLHTPQKATPFYNIFIYYRFYYIIYCKSIIYILTLKVNILSYSTALAALAKSFAVNPY